ncbi:MAG: UDP-glucose 4-epimerase GalE [Oscillospiraceae bacterium]
MSILVTGGAGYIGSHTVVELSKAGYDVVIADNFYNSSPEVLRRLKIITGKDFPFFLCDVCDKSAVEKVFVQNPDITAVIHFAAYKAVGESVEKPLDYYENNIGGALNVLQAMKKYGVKNFVFSSSATVYGDPVSVPSYEDFPAVSATSPYGWTKVMQEQILRDACYADKDFNVAILRYFNPIGAHESGLIGEDPNGIPNNLLPYVAQTAIGKHPFIRVYGDDYETPDGTGVRDYIHVVDLALGHVAAVKKLFTNPGVVTYNLGTGRGYSVLEIIHAYEKACKKNLKYEILPRRAGDIASNYAATDKAFNELGWKAKYTIEDMCRDSWNWQSKNPSGYKE